VRTALLVTPAVTLERLRVSLAEPQPTTWTPRRQVLVTLAGRFAWHVGRTSCLVDPSRVMFVERDEESVDTGQGEVDGVLATLADDVATELAPLFRARVARSTLALHAQVARLAQPEVVEEQVIAALGRMAREVLGLPDATAGAIALAHRAKERIAAQGRLVGLVELARDLGVSPAYLTDAFRRAEGVPLVRYQLQLRIRRALALLPHTDDLARLALDLGFASHSHFTAAFRRAIGVTPSAYRKTSKAPHPGSA
jgi:AraC-like DNA-binding protein